MPETSPVHKAVMEVLVASYDAVEQETSLRAQQLHEEAYAHDKSLTVGHLLARECIDFRKAFIGREKYYLNDANWFQRRRLERNGSVMPLTDDRPNTSFFPERIHRRVAKILRNKRIDSYSATFYSAALFPQEAEQTSAGPVIHEWRLSTDGIGSFSTWYRVSNPEQKIVNTEKLHEIHALSSEASVYHDKQPLDEDQLFFPLGLAIEANRQVRASVPEKISKKW